MTRPVRTRHLWPQLLMILPLAASASMNLALDKGCLTCHRTPPRGKAPSMTDLAARDAPLQGNEAEIARRSARLREHHLVGGVPAQERLRAEEAERFVRRLVGGGR